MQDITYQWLKTEMKRYILIFCAKVDEHELVEEITLIKSKNNPEIFDRLHKEFCGDNENICFEKTDDTVEKYPCSQRKIAYINKEVPGKFNSDKNFKMKENYLDKVLDNLLY